MAIHWIDSNCELMELERRSNKKMLMTCSVCVDAFMDYDQENIDRHIQIFGDRVC